VECDTSSRRTDDLRDDNRSDEAQKEKGAGAPFLHPWQRNDQPFSARAARRLRLPLGSSGAGAALAAGAGAGAAAGAGAGAAAGGGAFFAASGAAFAGAGSVVAAYPYVNAADIHPATIAIMILFIPDLR
jgi:hypothetical protein